MRTVNTVSYITRMFRRASSILLVVFAFSSEDALSQPELRVSDITIVGNRALSETTILEQMEMKTVSWFSEHILQHDPSIFDPSMLEADLRSIETLYQREGYLFVRVLPPELTTDQPAGSVALTLRIEEHAPVLVKDVAVTLPDLRQDDRHITDSLLAPARAGFVLTRESVFRDAHLNADRKALLTALVNGGYPFAAVNYSLAVDSTDTTVSVRWVITPGPAAVFGAPSVTGNEYVSQDLVLNRLRFQEGDRYDAGKLESSQSAVYNLGLFNAVVVSTNPDDSTARTMPVTVTVKEARRLRLLLGAGYGKDEQFRLSAELRLLDVFGGGDRLSLELKRSALQPYEIKLTFIQPDFLFRDVTLSLIPTIRSETETAYSMKRRGSRVSLERPLFSRLSGSVGYGVENVSLDTSSIATTNPPGQVLDEYTKHSMTFSLLWNDAAPLFDPVGGMSVTLRFTLSGLAESDPYNFTRTLLDLRRYDRLWEGTVIASRFAIGNARSRDAGGFIPVEERFYAGGSNSNRGWARFQLGPTDPSGTPVGGSSLIDGSFEIRQQISGHFATALFMDYAEVQEPAFTYSLSALQFAAGIGLRYMTSIGPIRLDIAKPIFAGDLPVQYLFSIGHAF